MPDDDFTDGNSADKYEQALIDAEERRILEILKGGFETKYILRQRVFAPQDDPERDPDSDS